MTLSIRLTAEDEALIKRAAAALRISESEFVRRSIVAYASEVLPAEIDALHIGRGGGLREPESVADPGKRAIVERLREKRGYAR
jgi:hypothetical protein